MEVAELDKEVPLEYQLFALAFKQEGAISEFAEYLPSDMVGAIHGNIGIHEFYSTLLEFHHKTGLDPIDPIAFRSWIESESQIQDALGGAGGVGVFMDMVLNQELSTPSSVIKVLKHRANKKRQLEALGELQTLLGAQKKSDKDLERINKLIDQVRILENDLGYDPLSSVSTGHDIAQRIDDLMEIPTFLPTPFKQLNKAMGYSTDGGYFRGAVHAIVAPSGKGKALALDTPIPTPTGWTTMGDLAVGDSVLGNDGLTYRVTNLSQIFRNHDCYKVVFSDGSEIVADANHQWEVKRDGWWRRPRIKTTEELFRLIGKGTFYVPSTSAIKYSEEILPVDPYELGVWLGDEHSRITSEDSFAIEMRELGLISNKYIPTQFLHGSVKQRLALLQGLIDSYGSACTAKRRVSEAQVEFCTTNKILANNVLELVRSLSIFATLGEVLNGEDSEPIYRIEFITNLLASRLFGKAEGVRRSISSIDKVESVPTRCIEVDSPNHLYLAGGGFIPTHNSTFAKNLVNYWADLGYTTLFVNFEEARSHWERILFTQICGENVYARAHEWSDLERKHFTAMFKNKLEEWGDRFMVRHDPDTSYFDDLEKWLRDIIGHGGRIPDVVVIDTIQSLLGKGNGPRWADYELMMIRLERLAKEMNAVFILTAQQNTAAAKEKREVIEQHDVGGSISIVQKCAVITVITPKKMVSGDESEDDDLYQLQIPKNRITGSTFVYDPPLVRYNDNTKSYEDFEGVDEDAYDATLLATNIFGDDFHS